MHDFDLIYTKGGKVKIRVPLVYEIAIDIAGWREEKQYWENQEAKEEGRGRLITHMRCPLPLMFLRTPWQELSVIFVISPLRQQISLRTA